jgi:hypothetical protein
MSRSLWFVAGAGVGVYAMNRARRVAESLTVDGLRDRASGLAAGARIFRDEVAQGRAEKETQLRERLGLVPDGGGFETLAGARSSTSGGGAGGGFETLAGARSSTSGGVAGARSSTSGGGAGARSSTSGADAGAGSSTTDTEGST